jgi:KDO2-lipid IV(A) lauroyltransferase
MPLKLLPAVSKALGALLYRFVPKRRTIALDNLRHAFASNRTDAEINDIAIQSFGSFFQTFLEIIKFRYVFRDPAAFESIRQQSPDLDALFQKAKAIHDESKGCLFVTPHIGNWELLPHVSALVGIPLAVVARPLDNEYLERLIFMNRTATGQVLIPKRNAFFMLQETLARGKSIGMLPDQSTMKGITVQFFGRPATATPVPALLAITNQRPLVVVACCRRDDGGFDGFVSDPIRPGFYTSEKAEIFRLTEEVTRQMEIVISRYPSQYLWMHNRWKTYQNKKEFMA